VISFLATSRLVIFEFNKPTDALVAVNEPTDALVAVNIVAVTVVEFTKDAPT
jgi:hypothetical protein